MDGNARPTGVLDNGDAVGACATGLLLPKTALGAVNATLCPLLNFSGEVVKTLQIQERRLRAIIVGIAEWPWMSCRRLSRTGLEFLDERTNSDALDLGVMALWPEPV